MLSERHRKRLLVRERLETKAAPVRALVSVPSSPATETTQSQFCRDRAYFSPQRKLAVCLARKDCHVAE